MSFKLSSPEPHTVNVLNPEIANDDTSIISYHYLKLLITSHKDPLKSTIITISKADHSIVFREIIEEICKGDFMMYPGTLQLTNYALMGNIIPVNKPFLFEDETFAI